MQVLKKVHSMADWVTEHFLKTTLLAPAPGSQLQNKKNRKKKSENHCICTLHAFCGPAIASLFDQRLHYVNTFTILSDSKLLAFSVASRRGLSSI